MTPLGEHAMTQGFDQGRTWTVQSSHITDGVSLGNSSLSFAFNKP
jgi:hypothetical protein